MSQPPNRKPRPWALLAGIVSACVSASGALLGAPPAAAATQPPVYTSWYVGPDWYDTFAGSDNNPFFHFGCDQPSGATVILDFGAMTEPSPGVYDFDTWEYGFESPSTVEDQIAQVLDGYHACNASGQLNLIVGTNNSNGNYGYDWSAMGSVFASVVDYWQSASDYRVSAGDDIEPQWSGPSSVLTFLSAYNSSDWYGEPLYDFGWLDGSSNNGVCDGYPGGWTSDDFFQVIWGDAYDYPYLTLYAGTATGDTGCMDWGNQTAQLDWYSATAYGSEWNTMGVLTENVYGTETPSEAFADQETALADYGLTTPIEYNSQIQPLG